MKLWDRLADLGLASVLYRGSLLFLAIYLAGSAISFGVHLLIARVLGAESYGQFAYATSWMAILILGCNIGLKPTVVRFAAHYLARREWGMLRGLLRTSSWWTIGASGIVLFLVLLALWFVRPRLDELGWTLLLVAVAMPFMALSEVWSSATRGLGAVARSQVPASIAQHSLFGVLLLCAVGMYGPQGGGALAAGSFLVATIATALISRWFLYRETQKQVVPADPLHARGEWFEVAGGNALIALFQAARAPIIVVISAAYVDVSQVAFYVAASRLANVMSLGFLGIAGFAGPLVSHYYALGDRAKLQQLAHLSARASVAGAAATAFVLIVFGSELLRLFGQGFEAAYGPLLVLLCGEIVAATTGPVGYFMTMTGGQMTATRIEAVTSVVAVITALMLIPDHGILGAAIAVAAGSVLRNAAMFAATWRQLGLRSAPF